MRRLRGRKAAAAAILLLCAACGRDLDMLEPAPYPAEPEVFHDDFGPSVQYAAFAGSMVDALDIEYEEVYRGTAALKFTVPSTDDPSGGFAGGAFFSTIPRDLTGFDALTFWAKASTAAPLNTVGIGNDNTGTSRYPVTMDGLPLSTRWTKYAIPIPLPSRLSRERGLFQLADATEFDVGYTIYLDDVQFERLGTIVNPRPAISHETVSGEVGGTLAIRGTQVTFDVNGTDVTVFAAPAYFTFVSSDPGIASVGPGGTITLLQPGTATITAMLGSTPASGALTIIVERPPSDAPPVPAVPAEDVTSLFSDAYDDVPVDTWSAEWDQADVADVIIAENPVKKYSNLAFAGIEFTSPTIDATSMTHLHVDLWSNDVDAFRIKLVDFGANGVFGGGDDSEHEVTLSPVSTPSLKPGEWNTLDIPLDAFRSLANRGHLAQLIISGSSATVYLDNIYFFRGDIIDPTGPTEPAPTPTDAAADVISLFSDAYTDVVVDTWSAEWDVADVADVEVAGDAVKLYENLVFAGIEFTSQTLDVTAMTHFRMDIWTPDETAAAAFKVKLVDFGANGVWDGGGDDSEHEVTIRAADGLATGEWVQLDLALADFTGLAETEHLAQLIISGDLSTVYADNVYFRRPASAAPSMQNIESNNQ